METLRMQPGRFSKLYLVTPTSAMKNLMEPVAAIAAHLTDINFITLMIFMIFVRKLFVSGYYY